MSCPGLIVEDRFNEKFYCKFKEDYVDYNRYQERCYDGWSTDHLYCPVYKREVERRERMGLPRI